MMDQRQLVAEVERVVRGDADALQRLIVHYHAPLRRLIGTRIEPDLRRYLDPDDVLQQAYVAAFKSLAGCRFDRPGGFYKWLEAIVLCRLTDARRALRRQKRDVARELGGHAHSTASYPDLIQRLAAGDPTPSRQFAREEAIAAVMSCLARLSDDRRAVIRLRFLEGRPVAEVARQLGKSEAAVHQLCSRGLESLRKLVGSITQYLTHL